VHDLENSGKPYRIKAFRYFYVQKAAVESSRKQPKVYPFNGQDWGNFGPFGQDWGKIKIKKSRMALKPYVRIYL
jgi:hypothetical protein